MGSAALKMAEIDPVSLRRPSVRPRLAAAADLGRTVIEVPLVGDLSADLHRMFDSVTEATLPIYFGPLLGRLYLEGL